jgi:hypothetical protein
MTEGLIYVQEEMEVSRGGEWSSQGIDGCPLTLAFTQISTHDDKEVIPDKNLARRCAYSSACSVLWMEHRPNMTSTPSQSSLVKSYPQPSLKPKPSHVELHTLASSSCPSSACNTSTQSKSMPTQPDEDTKMFPCTNGIPSMISY